MPSENIQNLICDGSWEIVISIPDIDITETLRVKGDFCIGSIMLMLVDKLDIPKDWSDYALWWPAKNIWVHRPKSTLDHYGVQANAHMEFTRMHKRLRIQLPDMQITEMSCNFSIPVFSVVSELCKQTNIRYPEELSLCRPYDRHFLRTGRKRSTTTGRNNSGLEGPLPAKSKNASHQQPKKRHHHGNAMSHSASSTPKRDSTDYYGNGNNSSNPYLTLRSLDSTNSSGNNISNHHQSSGNRFSATSSSNGGYRPNGPHITPEMALLNKIPKNGPNSTTNNDITSSSMYLTPPHRFSSDSGLVPAINGIIQQGQNRTSMRTGSHGNKNDVKLNGAKNNVVDILNLTTNSGTSKYDSLKDVSFASSSNTNVQDSSLNSTPHNRNAYTCQLVRPKTFLEKARINDSWLNSSLSLMEQGILEDQIIMLRFKFYNFFDLNPKLDEYRIHLLFQHAKNCILYETVDCTDEEAILFAALQLQSQVCDSQNTTSTSYKYGQLNPPYKSSIANSIYPNNMNRLPNGFSHVHGGGTDMTDNNNNTYFLDEFSSESSTQNTTRSDTSTPAISANNGYTSNNNNTSKSSTKSPRLIAKTKKNVLADPSALGDIDEALNDLQLSLEYAAGETPSFLQQSLKSTVNTLARKDAGHKNHLTGNGTLPNKINGPGNEDDEVFTSPSSNSTATTMLQNLGITMSTGMYGNSLEIKDKLKLFKPKKFPIKTFKTHFTVYKDARIFCYENDDSYPTKPPLLVIDLKGSEIVPDVNVSHKKYAIKIRVPQAKGIIEYWLKCETEQQYAKWMAACRLASSQGRVSDVETFKAEMSSILAFLRIQTSTLSSVEPQFNGRNGDVHGQDSIDDGSVSYQNNTISLPTPNLMNRFSTLFRTDGSASKTASKQTFRLDECVPKRTLKKYKQNMVNGKIIEAHSNICSLNSMDAKMAYIRSWQALSEFGFTYFTVRFVNQPKKEELLAIAHNRIIKIDMNSGEHVKSWRFTNMKNWSVNWEIKMVMLEFVDPKTAHNKDSTPSNESQNGQYSPSLLNFVSNNRIATRKLSDSSNDDKNTEKLCFYCTSTDCKVVHEFIGGYVFTSMRSKEENVQTLDETLFHKLTGECCA